MLTLGRRGLDSEHRCLEGLGSEPPDAPVMRPRSAPAVTPRLFTGPAAAIAPRRLANQSQSALSASTQPADRRSAFTNP
jgi:hypothetical protein